MKKKDNHSAGKVRCATCRAAVPSYDIVHYGSIEGGYRKLCNQCLNTEVAEQFGLEDFEHFRFSQVVMTDCAGIPHEFHFRTRLLGTMIALDAFELENGTPAGYQFGLIGDPEDDLLSLLGRLIEKMRRSLSVKHLVNSDYGLQIAKQTVRAQISSDLETDDRLPLLIIDGREVSWEQFGHMLMTFEGFQFRMEIVDRSDEM